MFLKVEKQAGAAAQNFLAFVYLSFIKQDPVQIVYNESCLSNLFEQSIFVLLLFLSRRTFDTG
jgi:hypothetical protein